jgi:hypothetical protein
MQKRSALEIFISRIKMRLRRINIMYVRWARIFRALVIIAALFIYWEKLQ